MGLLWSKPADSLFALVLQCAAIVHEVLELKTMAALSAENLVQHHSEQLFACRTEPVRVEALLVDCTNDM
eukprot:2413991-Rhodomonas_salina.1